MEQKNIIKNNKIKNDVNFEDTDTLKIKISELELSVKEKNEVINKLLEDNKSLKIEIETLRKAYKGQLEANKKQLEANKGLSNANECLMIAYEEEINRVGVMEERLKKYENRMIKH